MRYLSETVTYWICPQGCGSYHQNKLDLDDEEVCCPSCGAAMTPEDQDRPAAFWSVAVYEVCSNYGGPEEGGWWFSVGNAVSLDKIRVFTSYARARAYQSRLIAKIEKRHPSADYWLEVHGFTDEFPQMYWPRRRPHYH